MYISERCFEVFFQRGLFITQLPADCRMGIEFSYLENVLNNAFYDVVSGRTPPLALKHDQTQQKKISLKG